MSSLTFHEICLTPVLNGLKNAHAFITKAEEHVNAKNIDPNDLLTARIHPDMLDFTFQVQRFTDAAKFIPSRINPANEGLSLPDTEKTFSELLERIQKTISYLESIDPKSFEGREQEDVPLTFGGGKIKPKFTAAQYIFQYAHANVWFHITTAYDILRAKGVDVGKLDFLNGAKIIEIQ
ncbi:hypothetical protein T440DRAFT_261143 [Plenodomus tracheiphilus IPT5]|uniref:Uncharacterized protein n=1 Tax=Plenodomus tracheiphilus IPT5 TaxID=1408161 RepID=A0A6A7AQT0_9PLEO|nr:hypothetical protein T440DRAFT_261143 [Plenodomus tracheiphilus IPT5]